MEYSQKASQLAVVVTPRITASTRPKLAEGFTASCGCDESFMVKRVSFISQKASQLAVVVTPGDFYSVRLLDSQKASQLAVVVTVTLVNDHSCRITHRRLHSWLWL